MEVNLTDEMSSYNCSIIAPNEKGLDILTFKHFDHKCFSDEVTPDFYLNGNSVANVPAKDFATIF